MIMDSMQNNIKVKIFSFQMCKIHIYLSTYTSKFNIQIRSLCKTYKLTYTESKNLVKYMRHSNVIQELQEKVTSDS